MSAPQRGPHIVMKFGGTSVGSAEALGRAAAIVGAEFGRGAGLVVVTSALSGVTDDLMNCAIRAASGDDHSYRQVADELLNRHGSISGDLIQDSRLKTRLEKEFEELVAGFSALCHAIYVLGETTPRALDAVVAHGERLSVRLLAAVLEDRGIPANYVEATGLIVTDSQFQSAHPRLEASRAKSRQVLLPMLEQGKVPVVTGFIGATAEGITTTLGRGGSDFSAALLGAVLPADEVWIWTDVDGVMTADPRIVPNARTIPALSYRELSELAYFGAKVIHPRTVLPVVDAGVGLLVKNTFRPELTGTRLVPGSNEKGGIKAVTTVPDQRLITIEGRGMLGVPGVAARTFGAVAETGTNVILISQASSEQSICFAIPSASAPKVIAAVQKEFAVELANRDIDRVWDSGEVVIATAVGAGMRHTLGVAGKIFSALGQAGVNVVAIAQGSSEAAISMVVEAADLKKTVRALHELI